MSLIFINLCWILWVSKSIIKRMIGFGLVVMNNHTLTTTIDWPACSILNVPSMYVFQYLFFINKGGKTFNIKFVCGE